MRTSTAKRVVLYRFDRQPVDGFVNPGFYLAERGIELITPEGTLQTAGYAEVKAVCFVSEFGSAALFTEDIFFERRPKLAGLWARFIFRDGDRLEGVLPANLPDWPAQGYLFTPPRAGQLRQRVFVPRAALLGAELRGVIGSLSAAPVRGKKKTAPKTDGEQMTIFDS